jgi:hypothetical protein
MRGRMAMMRRGFRGLGRGARIAGIAGLGLAGLAGLGAIFNAGGAQASQTQFNPETGEMELVEAPVPQGPSTGEKVMSSLSGGMEGAMLGATIGSIVPGIGTAAGAVIGGIIGGIAPLLNEGVMKGIGEFMSGFGRGIDEMLVNIGNGLTGFWTGVNKKWTELLGYLSGGVKNVSNALIWVVNQAISNLTLLPRVIISGIESIANTMPGVNKIPGLMEGIEAAKSAANFQIGYFYRGKNNLSTILNREAMFSGADAMVVNSEEYVIPKGEMPKLASAIGGSIRSSSVENPGSISSPLKVQVNLTINSNSIVADPSELVNALREPVTQIIEDAFNEASQKQIVNYS